MWSARVALSDIPAQPIPVFLITYKIDLIDKIAVDIEAAVKFAAEHWAKFAKINPLNRDGVHQLFTDIIFEFTKINLSNEVQSRSILASERSKKYPF
jgi:predicted dienelactone hydrolase